MKLQAFLYQYPVFTWEDYSLYLTERGQKHLPTQKALLNYHKKQGHIIHIRQGLYAAVPPGHESKAVILDPYLIASRMASDAVISHHTALSLHGIAYSIFHRIFFTSQLQIKPFTYQRQEFIRVNLPKGLSDKDKANFGVEIKERQGLELKVTSLSRALVDVLNKPALGGGVEEIWQSFGIVAQIDIEQIIQYIMYLKNATLAAKVGFFLEQHQQQLAVTELHLSKLEQQKPRSKHYFDNASRHQGVYLKRWNLIVGKELLSKNWEDPHVLI